jgi:hypothetical protein
MKVAQIARMVATGGGHTHDLHAIGERAEALRCSLNQSDRVTQ